MDAKILEKINTIISKSKQIIKKDIKLNVLIPLQPQQDSDGRYYVTAQGSRKTTDCEVKLIYPGTGKITVNEKDFGSFFYALRSRYVVCFYKY